MNRYLILDKNSFVKGTIEGLGEFDLDHYVDFEEIDTHISFSDSLNMKYQDGKLYESIPEVEPVTEESERVWRNSEIKIVAPLLNEANHPYNVALQGYMKQLRDYPEQPGFPNGKRPERPLTPKGQPVII